MNPNNCAIKLDNSIFYFTLFHFKETGEFIASLLYDCPTSSYAYLVFSFDNNFNYSIFGTISNFQLNDS